MLVQPLLLQVSGETWARLFWGAVGVALILYGIVKWRTPKLNGFRARHPNFPDPGDPEIGPAERIFARLIAFLLMLIGLFFVWLVYP